MRVKSLRRPLVYYVNRDYVVISPAGIRAKVKAILPPFRPPALLSRLKPLIGVGGFSLLTVLSVARHLCGSFFLAFCRSAAGDLLGSYLPFCLAGWRCGLVVPSHFSIPRKYNKQNILPKTLF